RHFQVSQELAHVQECLFIPFSITPFNLSKVARWRDSLIRHLRNRSFREAFDAVDRVRNNWEEVDFPLARYADDRVTYVDGEFYIRLRLPRPDDSENGDFMVGNWSGYTTLLGGEPPENVWRRYLGVALPEHRQKIWDERIAPAIAQRL